jgi:hypothetical protein
MEFISLTPSLATIFISGADTFLQLSNTGDDFFKER